MYVNLTPSFAGFYRSEADVRNLQQLLVRLFRDLPRNLFRSSLKELN